MEIVTGRIAKIEDSLKKPIGRTEREPLQHEEATLKLVLWRRSSRASRSAKPT